MRILILTKRQYMGQDLLDDRYGRFWELPQALAQTKHKVTGLCLSYRPRHEDYITCDLDCGTISWHSANLWRLIQPGSKGYWQILDRLFADTSPPDLVWACSDVPHAVLGVYVARWFKAKLVIDLYDNFESYGSTQFPGMRTALHWAVNAADAITCISSPLAELVRKRYHYSGAITVIENAVPVGIFRPIPKDEARNTLNLPLNAILIGTAGALSHSRGIEILFNAFKQLAKDCPDIHLVLAGPVGRGLSLPQGDHIHYLGKLPPNRIPLVLNALDVAVICNRESAFGSYCFPQKFYESVACNVPVVVAATGAMREVLRDYPEYLFEPERVTSLIASLHRQIDFPSPLPLTAPTWENLGTRLADFLQQVCHQHTVE